MTARSATVGTIPYGKRLGYFKQEGIDLQINYDVPSSQQYANLLAGNTQFIASSWGSLVPIVINGGAVVGISGISNGGTSDADDQSQLVVLRDGPIKTLNDMRGKTIAVPTLGTTLEIEARYLLFKRAGLRSQDIKFAQLGFPDQPAALRAGRIDAMASIEPFITQASLQVPLRRLGGLDSSIVARQPTGNIVTSRAYLNANKSTVAAMRRALKRSIDAASRNLKKYRAFLPEFLRLDEAIVKKMRLNTLTTNVDLAKVSRYITIANNLGKLPSKPKPETFAVLK